MATDRRRHPVDNGPAQPAPKPVEPLLIDPGRCHCPTGPTTVASFAGARLVAVERRHLRSDGCAHPAEPVDPAAWQATARRRGSRR